MLVSACDGSPTTRITGLTVGSSFASINKLANSQETAIGNISVDDLSRFSASGQLTFLRGEVGQGLQFNFHNHLPDDVGKMMLRIVITKSDATIVSDRTYEWTASTDAYGDSASINIPIQRSPRPGETFVWGFVGASKK
jgi:hypothetical protein